MNREPILLVVVMVVQRVREIEAVAMVVVEGKPRDSGEGDDCEW